MSIHNKIEALYQEAQTALKRREYDRAAGLLKQVLLVNENSNIYAATPYGIFTLEGR